jgi:hypothetical protein
MVVGAIDWIITYFIEITPYLHVYQKHNLRCVIFAQGNNMLSALEKYVINRLIHGLFHIALVISPRLISSLGLITRAI